MDTLYSELIVWLTPIKRTAKSPISEQIARKDIKAEKIYKTTYG